MTNIQYIARTGINTIERYETRTRAAARMAFLIERGFEVKIF